MKFDHQLAKKHGYFVCVTDTSDTIIPNALHIELDGEQMVFESDYEAAKVAERDGIPIIHDIDGCEDWTYVDTEENRILIQQMLERYPRFDCRTWDKPDSNPWTTENLFASDLEISSDGQCVESTFECYFSWGEKFGINFDRIEDDANDMAWLNLFADYDPKKGTLEMYYTVNDNSKNESFRYTPSPADRATAIHAMEIECNRSCGCSLASFVMRCNEGSVNDTFCEVIFHCGESSNVLSVLLKIDPSHYHDLGSDFSLSSEDRQAAYELAATAVGDESLKDYVIGSASVFRSTQFLLVEVNDSSIYEVSDFASHATALRAMCNRLCEIRDISLDSVEMALSSGESIDDDTQIEEFCAHGERFGNPYDWTIFQIDPVPGSKFVSPDLRCLLFSLENQHIAPPEVFNSEDEARIKAFEKARELTQKKLSGHISFKRYGAIEVIAPTDIVCTFGNLQYSWIILPLEELN